MRVQKWQVINASFRARISLVSRIEDGLCNVQGPLCNTDESASFLYCTCGVAVRDTI